MLTLKFTVTMQFAADGVIDPIEIQDHIAEAIERAVANGAITPNDERHATMSPIFVVEFAG